MLERSLLINLPAPLIGENTHSQLRQDYQANQYFFQEQSASVQQFLNAQAAGLTHVLVSEKWPLYFYLPEKVTLQLQSGGLHTIFIPERLRRQSFGSWLNRMITTDLPSALRMKLLHLEQSSDQAVSSAAFLVRHALAMYIVHDYLPMGRSVQYSTEEEDDIPCYPTRNYSQSGAIGGNMEEANAKVSHGADRNLNELDAEAVMGFFMPQWVAFDDQQHLLAADLQEVDAHILAMQRYLRVLNIASELAPYMVVDEEYHIKRYGILGQLVNQGRTYASYLVTTICQTIERRSASQSLDRGFSLSIPFFNDQTLSMETYNFEVIPKGRVMFVPAFVVLAVRAEAVKVSQNTRLNSSTRRSLLNELCQLERAFLR